ncbi:MAG: nitroreductase family protein [Prevotellaceae bacterium]|nr:nitroreductase family protein [Prevotellaceae bacterium]
MKDILTVMAQRKSVRHFQPEEVPNELLDTALHAAMAAPSAKNQQVWEFIVLRDRALLDALAAQLPYAKMLAQASVAVAVCGDTSKNSGEAALNWVADCAAAAENFLLAIEALGLGAVWTAAFPYADRTGAVCRTLNLPAHIVPLCVIPVGYPAKDEPVKDKWRPEKIHYNQW